MKRTILTGLLALVACMAAFAQKALLDLTAAELKKGGVEATFTATASRGGKSLGTTSGTLYVKQNKFKLVSEGMTSWFDGRTQWALLKGGDEVNVTTPTAAELAQLNPYNFVNLYKKGYALSQRTVEVAGVQQPEVTLKAQSPSATIQKMVIVIHKTTHLPLAVRVTLKNGATTDIKLKRVRNRQKYADGLFVYRAAEHPGVAVNDLR